MSAVENDAMKKIKGQASRKTKNPGLFGLKDILPFAKVYRKEIIVMCAFGLVSSGCDSIYPLFNRYALDKFVGEGTMATIKAFIGLYLIVLAFQAVTNYVSMLLIGKVELYVGRDLKNACFAHLQEVGFSYFNTHNVGYIHARIISDTDRIATIISWRLMDFVWNISYLVLDFIIMIRINAGLGLLLLVLIPPAAVLIMLFERKLLKANRRVREMNSRISGDFNEGITGAKSIRAMVVHDRIERDFNKDTRKMRGLAVRSTQYSAMFSATVTLMSSVALAIVLWRGGSLTAERVMRIGSLSVFMSYALNMVDPIQNIIEAIAALVDVQVNIERSMELLHTEPDVKDTPEVIEKYGDSFSPKRENWEPLYGNVEFRDVSFTYPDGTELVLEHFNLKVPKGTNVAIVGETGAGKSTLVNLVCRFYEPTSGEVLIDGRDVRERSQLWLHSNIGYVLQTPHLFSGTVRENLRYGKPDATDEEIMRALELVSADDVVARMDKGLDSEVGEGGDLLSTGEKQLLSFARAIIADPAILVLDEATSSIDTVTEKKIQNAINVLINGRTSFIIAHRLSTITGADVILTVSDGKIVESGTHEELMKKHGYYYRLYTRQYEDAETRRAL
ncbi:MAG: ABC transporter ATP-binding protein [Eubacterium sp.]